MKNMDIIIANDNERDDLFAEIYHGEMQWAEVINDPSTGRFLVEIWTPAPGGSHVLDLEDAQEALEQAKGRLISMGYPEKR